MAITALPIPPSRQDPTNFNDRADAFLGALPLFQTEANTLQTDVNAKQLAATVSETNAAASALAAANTSNASLWVSGSTYVVGDNRFSPINYLTYRRKTDGAGTVDPSNDTINWQLLTGLGDVTTSGNQTISGVKTFTSTISGNISGNANTATSATNATNATNSTNSTRLATSSWIVEESGGILQIKTSGGTLKFSMDTTNGFTVY